MPAVTEDELEPTTPASPEDNPQDPIEPSDDSGGSAFSDGYDPMTAGLEEDDDAGEPAPEPASDDRPRGPDGKFIKATDTAPPTEETPPPADAGPAAVASEAAGAPSPDDAPVPWTANLYGEEAQPIPGALYKAGHGVFVPEREVGTLTALVARGRKYDEFKQERQQWAKEREALVAPVQAEARAVAEVLAQVLNADWITQAALDPGRALQDVALTLRERQLQLREQYPGQSTLAAQTTPGPVAEIDPYDAQATVRAEVTELLASPDYHGLFSSQDVQAMERRLTALHPFVQDEQGRWYLDRQVVKEFFATAAEAPKRLAAERQAAQARQAAAEAAKRNRQVTAHTTPVASPAKPKAKAASSAFDGPAWENPALSFDERKAAWLAAHGG